MSETLAAAERRMAQELAAAGIGEAALEARLLLSHITGLSRAMMIAQSDRSLTPDEVQSYRQALARRLLFEKYSPGYSGDLANWRDTALPVAVEL